MKLDYTVQDPQQRNKIVTQIVNEAKPEQLTPYYLKILADYLVFAMDKEDKREKKINTQNRMVTINKRETSFEGLVTKFGNNEDYVYNLIANDKNIIFTPKISITPEDLQTIPGLQQLRDQILKVQAEAKAATGKKKYLLKKQAIEMRKDQYVLKSSYKKNINFINAWRSGLSHIQLDQKISLDQNNNIKIEGNFSLLKPEHVSAILNNYSKLKQDSWGQFNSDSYYMLLDLQNLVDETLEEDYPMYYDLLKYKIDGKTNLQIQALLARDYGVTHTVEYISSLWRKKIPKLISERAKKDWLIYHYTMEVYGKWKRCSRCHQIKPANNMFFSKNGTSKDGFYSICKDCRNAKTKKMRAPQKRRGPVQCKEETGTPQVRKVNNK